MIYSKTGKIKNYYKKNDKYFSNYQFATLWNIRYELFKKDLNHNASFPVKIPEKLIEILLKDDGIVLDPFLGSGTTAVACEKLKRNWIGIELNQEYCDIANKRVESWMNQSRIDNLDGFGKGGEETDE